MKLHTRPNNIENIKDILEIIDTIENLDVYNYGCTLLKTITIKILYHTKCVCYYHVVREFHTTQTVCILLKHSEGIPYYLHRQYVYYYHDGGILSNHGKNFLFVKKELIFEEGTSLWLLQFQFVHKLNV